MKTRDDVLNVLGGLGAQDRQWIIDRLPPTLRAELLVDKTMPVVSVSSKSEPAINALKSGSSAVDGAAVTRLDCASARSIISLLEVEPVWVLHALLQASNWSWRDEVLELSNSATRNEVARLNTAGVRYAKKLADALLVEAAQRVKEESAHESISPFSKWWRTLESISTRRRLRMRA